jgi:hypothetical protein
VSYAGGQTVRPAHSQEARNPLHANKMHRPDRKRKPNDINETLSQQSTLELSM